MSTATSNRDFHTVVIRGDLPKIEQDDNNRRLRDLPDEDYWIESIIDYNSPDRWNRDCNYDRYKVQHMIANGPCKFFHIHFLMIY